MPVRTADRLRLLREAYGLRADRRSPADLAYAVYVALLLVPLVAYPALRAIALALGRPPALTVLSSPGRGVGVVLGLLAAAVVWLGRLYGPVTLEPAFVRVRAGTDLPRHATLARPFAARAPVVVVLVTGAAAVVSGVLVQAGVAPVSAGLRFTSMSAGFGVLAAVGWLAGQAVGHRLAGSIGAGIAALSVLGWFVGPVVDVLPWGWIGAAWPTAISTGPTWLPAAQAVALLGVCVAAVWCVRPLLDLLTAPGLLEDAERWRAAGTAALSGDVAYAVGRLRARPSVGRGWRVVRTRHAVTRFVLRDLLGGMRTPVRFAVGALALVVAGALLAVAPGAAAGWALGGVGGGLGFLALGVFADGLRHAADAAAAPALYGYSTTTLFALHTAVPVAAAVSAAVAGLAVALALGAAVSALAGLLVMAIVVAARAYDSARGPLPIALLTPMPGPFGDMSGLTVAAWQADALLISSGAGAVVAAGVARGPVGAVVLSAVLCYLLVRAMRRRTRR